MKNRWREVLPEMVLKIDKQFDKMMTKLGEKLAKKNIVI